MVCREPLLLLLLLPPSGFSHGSVVVMLPAKNIGVGRHRGNLVPALLCTTPLVEMALPVNVFDEIDKTEDPVSPVLVPPEAQRHPPAVEDAIQGCLVGSAA